MDNFRFHDWNDELFRKQFLRFLNKHEQRMNDFMKQMYGQKPEESDDFKRLNDYLNKMLGDLNNNFDVERGEDEYGPWERTSWMSPDGTSMYTSFNLYGDKQNKKENLKNVNTIELLEEKLKKSILVEDYESAAKIRDLIKSLENKEEK